MSTIMPQGENIRKAVKWISDQLELQDAPSINKLINDASLRFDLSPNEGQFLINFYADRQRNSDD